MNNRSMIENIYNMLSQPVYTFNIDSGRRWLLNDVAGKPIRLWDNQHREIRNTYDTLQRPLSLSLCLSAFVVNLIQKTVYGTSSTNNLKGQIAEKYDQSGKTQFGAYDFKGNVLSLSKQLCQDYKQTIDWNRSPAMETETFVQTFSYDAMNRPVNITKPDNSLIAHSYNKAGLLETVKARLRGSLSWTDFVTNINYNEKGQRTEIYFANDSKTAYTYDDKTFRLNRLLTTRYKGQDVLQDLNYEYDPVGNITRLRDDAQQTFYFDNAVIVPESRYTYDALYRLTEATGREIKALAMPTHNDFANNLALPNPASNALQNYTQQYTYDALGNIQRMQSKGYWTRDYFYNTGVNSLKGHTSGVTTYTYDEHGNTTEMPDLTTMQYDHYDQLREVDLGGGGNAYYVYDTNGERVRKVIEKTGGIVEQRIYLGGWEVYRKTISGNLNFERETLHISDNAKKIASIEAKTVQNGMDVLSHPAIRYQYDNHLGSASLELDENAAIISYEEYHPFGTTSYRSGRTETEVSLKRYKYVGKERDEETGLYYYGARYFAGWLGRFVSVDPKADERQWLNPYNYVQNNPINRIDPDGALDDDPPKGANPELYGKNANAIQSNKGSKIFGVHSIVDSLPAKFEVSLEELKEYFPNGNEDVLKELGENLNKYMGDFGIDNNTIIAHFLSQAGHETGGFKKSSVTESLYYTTEDRLKNIFTSYFGEGKENEAKDYLKDSKKLANLVYADRLGNSDTESGEGYKYRGRGMFQLTGKDNYEQFSNFYKEQFDSKTNLVDTPELLATDSKIAIISALWFFQKNVINKIDMKKASVDTVTKNINPAKAGIKDRINIFNRIIKIQKQNDF